MTTEELGKLRRVSVVGSSCSGKSTFAKKLGRALQTQYVELDSINWLPGWVERPADEFKMLVGRAAAEENWVFDGNYSRTQDIAWARATAIIWLNYSFSRTFYRALKRTMHRILTGELICSGNRETFRQSFFSRDSIILWVLKTYHSKRRRYVKSFQSSELAAHAIYVFNYPQQAESFLRAVEELKNRQNISESNK